MKMEFGLYTVEGEYLLPSGSGGSQIGKIEVLEDFRLIGELADENEKPFNFGVTEKSIIGIYQQNEDRIYLLKTPFFTEKFMPVMWRFDKRRGDYFYGSYIFIPKMSSPIIQDLFGKIPRGDKGLFFKDIKKEIPREKLELLLLNPSTALEFDGSKVSNLTGYLQFTRI